MYVPDIGCINKKAWLSTQAFSAQGTGTVTTGSTATDVSGGSGKALIMAFSSAAGTTSTIDFDIQTADDNAFSVNASVVNTTAVGSDTESASFGVSAGNTAKTHIRSLNLDACRKFIRIRVIIGSASATCQVVAALIAGGFPNVVSGGDTF